MHLHKSASPSKVPSLLPLFGVFAILFGPSLCHLPDNGNDDGEFRLSRDDDGEFRLSRDDDGEFRLSLPLLLAAIPASFCLKVPKTEDKEEDKKKDKKEDSSAVFERHIREARRIYRHQSVDELVTMSRRLCDVFEAFWYQHLATMLQEALLSEIAVEDKAGMLRLEAILKACKDDEHYQNLSTSLIKFLVGNKSVTGFESKIQSISNKMIPLLIYDRLYRIFEWQLEAIIDQNNYASEDEKNVEFALKWLKQMRKAISTRYESNEAELKYLLDKSGKALEGTLIDRAAESDRKDRREQMAAKCSLRLDRLRNKSAVRVEAGALQLVDDEDKKRLESAMFEIWDFANQMKGTDDWILVVVREQIKLSLLNDTEEFLRDRLCIDEPECSQGGVGTAAGDCWHKKVLSEFLQQHTIAVEVKGRTVFDARKELYKFLTHYGYSRLQREFAKFYTDQKGNKWWHGRSLMRTLHSIQPNLEERMKIFWEYEKVLEKFEQIFDETRAKIEQIGAFTLYLYLYEKLLAQHIVGWEKRAKKNIPISYKQFLSPKEYIGYWLEQMQDGVEEHLRQANKEFKRLLELDRKKLRQIQRQGFVGGINEWENDEKWAIVKYEKNSIRKKVGHYLMKVGKQNDDKPKQFVPSWGPIGRQKDAIGTECPGTSAWPLSDKVPKGEDIERAIELNERMAKSIR